MQVKIVECPRDAMQGFEHFIPTHLKIDYLNALIKVGFDTIDCGSFVSPKAVPMLADTEEVLNGIYNIENKTKLLVIIANMRGAENAAKHQKISYWGYPFSISEQFQLRNTTHNISQSYTLLNNIQQLAISQNKQVLAYLSMGFGNPYKEDWSIPLALDWCKKIADLGIQHISLSDTIGVAKPQDIEALFTACNKALPHVEFGAHLHTRADNYLANITAAYNAGCRKFDTAIKGLGGCPFATDKLTGNLPTENLLAFLEDKNIETTINKSLFNDAFSLAQRVFQ